MGMMTFSYAHMTYVIEATPRVNLAPANLQWFVVMSPNRKDSTND
jgi:hypothetical protein